MQSRLAFWAMRHNKKYMADFPHWTNFWIREVFLNQGWAHSIPSKNSDDAWSDASCF